ncbi:MAG: NTPase [Candidatus Zixiibacteriota bacterium]
MKNILITGRPGVGKTTIINKLTEHLREYAPAGFYTSEIRSGNIRRGFKALGLNGRSMVLAHTDIGSPCRVGKYGVDVAGFEKFLDDLRLLEQSGKVIIIDEIGKMECFSEAFRRLVISALDWDALLLATIATVGDDFVTGIKKRRDVELHTVTVANRDRLVEDLLKRILVLLSRR